VQAAVEHAREHRGGGVGGDRRGPRGAADPEAHVLHEQQVAAEIERGRERYGFGRRSSVLEPQARGLRDAGDDGGREGEGAHAHVLGRRRDERRRARTVAVQ